MFYFGTPEDIASLYWSGIAHYTGPALADCPMDEMTEKELRLALTYCRIAYKDALGDGASKEVLSILLEQHDEVFVALAKASERFRLRVKNGYCTPLTGHERESIDKYKRLAGVLD